jgi:hypothetical protein
MPLCGGWSSKVYFITNFIIGIKNIGWDIRSLAIYTITSFYIIVMHLANELSQGVSMVWGLLSLVYLYFLNGNWTFYG